VMLGGIEAEAGGDGFAHGSRVVFFHERAGGDFLFGVIVGGFFAGPFRISIVAPVVGVPAEDGPKFPGVKGFVALERSSREEERCGMAGFVEIRASQNTPMEQPFFQSFDAIPGRANVTAATAEVTPRGCEAVVGWEGHHTGS